MHAHEYDEERELGIYVWANYRELFDPVEQYVHDHARSPEFERIRARLWLHVRARDPARAARKRLWHSYRRALRQRAVLELAWRLRVNATSGAEVERAALLRVLREHAARICVNRCPLCARVVRTPRARQCLWCGHDWHAR